MRFSVFVTVEGQGFDLSAFQAAALQHGVAGEICERKHLGSKAVAARVQQRYWKSEIAQLESGDPEDTLLAIVKSLNPLGPSISANSAARVFAQIVVYRLEADPPRGFHVSAELAKALAKLDADLDIDVVLDLCEDDKTGSEPPPL